VADSHLKCNTPPKEIVEKQGGKATSSVSQKTGIVVVGDEVLDACKRSGSSANPSSLR